MLKLALLKIEQDSLIMWPLCMFELCDYVTVIYSTQASATGLVSVISASHSRQYCALQFTGLLNTFKAF